LIDVFFAFRSVLSESDDAECWNKRIFDLIKRRSPLNMFSRECIDEYAAGMFGRKDYKQTCSNLIFYIGQILRDWSFSFCFVWLLKS